MLRPPPPVPGRLRVPRGAYGWTDLRVVTGGWLERLGPDTALTYLFLCTVGNNQGVSFWSRGRVAHLLGLSRETLDGAFQKLVRADLIAVRDNVVQVLSLPSVEPAVALASDAPPSPSVTEEEIDRCEDQARAHIARTLGASHRAPLTVVRALATNLARQARTAAKSAGPSDQGGRDA